MQSGLYVALSSQIALERRLTTISDNMANVNTVGFRGSEVKFDEMVARNHNDMNARVAFVSQGNDYLSTRQGAFEQTGNSFDFAIKGDAWFSIETPGAIAEQVLSRLFYGQDLSDIETYLGRVEAVTPADIHATVLTALGYDPKGTTFMTADGRPMPLSEGEVIKGLL